MPAEVLGILSIACRLCPAAGTEVSAPTPGVTSECDMDLSDQISIRRLMPKAKIRSRRPEGPAEVILASADSNNMASSWTDYLMMRRTSSGTLILKLERAGADALPEEEWNTEGWVALHYEEEVGGPEWLCEFLENPHWKVAERISMPDTSEVLRSIATIAPGLASEAQELLKRARDES